MLHETILLAVVLSSPPGSPTDFAPPDFDPERAEVTVDDDGTLEIIAYDDRGAMLGALLATATEDGVAIAATHRGGPGSKPA